MSNRPVILMVGGTDPSGGAGLAADLKSASALGGHGCIAVTAVTAQNSGTVESWMPIPPEETESQIRLTCLDGIPDGVKSGMLGSPEMVSMLADQLSGDLRGIPYVLDPVMVAGSGDGLAAEGLEGHIARHLLPLASLATPNLDEAEAFTGITVRRPEQMETAAEMIMDMGSQAVLLKGGHLQDEPSDLLLWRRGKRWFPGRRIVPGKVHGTGCTLASACATLMGAGYDVETSVERALQYLRSSLAGSFHRKLGVLLGHFPPMGPHPSALNGSSFYRKPRFCPGCGGELLDQYPHGICAECGLVFYRNPLPAVLLVLEKEGKLLMARRAVAPAKGELCFPGGFIDRGESPEQTAERELAEETGLTEPSLRLLGAERDSTEYGSVVLFLYRVRSWKGIPEPADDVSELLWMNPEEIPKLAFPAHDRVLDMLKRKDR